MVCLILNSGFYRWNAQNSISISKKGRKICARLCWTVSAKYIGVNFTFTLNDLFHVQAYTQEGIHCDPAWALCTMDDLTLVYLSTETPLLIFAYTVTIRRQKWQHIFMGTCILLRENKDACNFSMVFCDKEKTLVPKNSHDCVNYHINVVNNNDNNGN